MSSPRLRLGEQHVGPIEVDEGHVGGVAVGIVPEVAKHHHEGASDFGRTRARISRKRTPSQTLSNVLQRVTQWKSDRTSAFGSAWKPSQVKVSGASTRPPTRKSQVSGSKDGHLALVQHRPLDRGRLARRAAAPPPASSFRGGRARPPGASTCPARTPPVLHVGWPAPPNATFEARGASQGRSRTRGGSVYKSPWILALSEPGPGGRRRRGHQDGSPHPGRVAAFCHREPGGSHARFARNGPHGRGGGHPSRGIAGRARRHGLRGHDRREGPPLAPRALPAGRDAGSATPARGAAAPTSSTTATASG